MTDTASLVIRGARILTMDPAHPRASAIAIAGETISFIGDDKGAMALAGASTRVIEADGATLLPGLIDCHAHLLSYGQSLVRLDLKGVESFEKLVQRTAAFAETLPKGRWIEGRGWDPAVWGSEEVDIDLLSKTVPDHPVYLKRYDGHAAIVNEAALAAAGISAQTANPPDGEIVRRGGRPTGLLIEAAGRLVETVIPEPGAPERRDCMALAARKLLSLGITSIFDAIDEADWIDDIRHLLREGTSMPRIIGEMRAHPSDDPVKIARETMFADEFDGRFSLSFMRFVMDGGMGPRGAALLEPYSDREDTSGYLMLPDEFVAAASRAALEAGWRLAVHAIGDRAIDRLVSIWEPLVAEDSARAERLMVEHCVMPSDEALSRLGRIGCFASVQPQHAKLASQWIFDRLGPDRARRAYGMSRLKKAGMQLALGSDFPVVPPDPRLTFACARKFEPQDDAASAWRHRFALSLEEILTGYTLDAARSAGMDKRIGILRAGMDADAVLFSGDLLSLDRHDILATPVLATLLKGAIVHEAF
ncbi:amidohydrolase [Mesorhizobium sp. 1B3]|uniref:amidohydrolase n=1 Tax=Mesorhizobium sp. 1B3 TaxID=3243599 RepID=UPI003D97AE63